MPKITFQLSAQAKKWIFICAVVVALVFVLFRFNRNSEFRVAKKAFQAKDYEAAAELFSQLGTYSDSDSYVIYCNALIHFEQGDYDTALELFEQLQTFQKSAKYILYTKGMIAYQNSQYWEAASLFEKCGESVLGHAAFLDNEIKAKMCYYTSGWLLESAGDYERAIVCYGLADDFDDAATRLKECEEALRLQGSGDGT